MVAVRLRDIRTGDIELAACLLVDFCHDMRAMLRDADGVTERKVNDYEARMTTKFYKEINSRSAEAPEPSTSPTQQRSRQPEQGAES